MKINITKKMIPLSKNTTSLKETKEIYKELVFMSSISFVVFDISY